MWCGSHISTRQQTLNLNSNLGEISEQKTNPRLRNSICKCLGAYRPSLQGRQDGPAGKRTFLQASWSEFEEEGQNWASWLPHAHCSSQAHTQSHKYKSVSTCKSETPICSEGEVNLQKTVNWGLPPRRHLTLSTFWDSVSQMTEILESQSVVRENWMYKFKNIFFLLFLYLRGGQKTGPGFSAHPASCLQGSCRLVGLWASEDPLSLLSQHSRSTGIAALHGSGDWDSGPHTWVTSVLPILPDPLI